MADSIERIAADCAWESHRIRNSGAALADYEAWERIATRLRALSPAGGDWVMVPRKITTAMWKAWEQSNLVSDSYQEDYAAMLAASPQQEPGAVTSDDSLADTIREMTDEFLATKPTPADESGAERRSTHHVHRGPESLPCYCDGEADHPIGQEATTPPAPSGQTLAGAGGEGERTLKQVGWMRFKNGGAEISTAQECPPDRSAGNASHWFAIHAYEARRNG